MEYTLSGTIGNIVSCHVSIEITASSNLKALGTSSFLQGSQKALGISSEKAKIISLPLFLQLPNITKNFTYNLPLPPAEEGEEGR